jgi:hypothetical protein
MGPEFGKFAGFNGTAQDFPKLQGDAFEVGKDCASFVGKLLDPLNVFHVLHTTRFTGVSLVNMRTILNNFYRVGDDGGGTAGSATGRSG